MELLKQIAKPRPVGTALNEEITIYIESYLESIGYEVNKVPFDCKVWSIQESFLVIDGYSITLQVNPYSQGFKGKRRALILRNLDELQNAECQDKIVFLTEDLVCQQLQPKNYPFYYPDKHKAVIDCLEEKKPCAIIAVTGKDSMSRLNPFPLIEDGNFHIPVASIDKGGFSQIEKGVLNKEIEVSIISENKEAIAYQLIASKKVSNSKGTIVICAHMDSKYNTYGALDNASGVVAMLLAAKGINNNEYDIEIVPFNSEEYYDPQGELIYLEEIKKSGKEIELLINIDTVAHIGSKIAVALFNFNHYEKQQFNEVMKDCRNIVSGEPWYAGDHAVFAFSGTKCVLISASDLFEGCLTYTHCPKDKIDLIDESLIEDAAEYICNLVNNY